MERGQLLIEIWTGLYNLLYSKISEYETEIEAVKLTNEHLMDDMLKKKDANIFMLEIALQNVIYYSAR